MSSVLGETGVIVGNVDGTGDFEVRGRVQGTIHVKGRVLVSETGVVLGGIEATTITVLGKIQGDLIAEDSLLVGALGRVEGNLSGPRIGIEAGARVRGVLRAGDEDEREPQLPPAPSEAKRQAPPQKAAVARESRDSLVETAPARDKTEDAEKRESKPRSPRSKLRPPKKARAAQSAPTADAPSPAPPSRGTKENLESPNDAPAERPKKKSRRRGPPTMPTFVKGTKGHQRN
jgi:cytoskeletal protein CcmA (bactofilin family)